MILSTEFFLDLSFRCNRFLLYNNNKNIYYFNERKDQIKKSLKILNDYDGLSVLSTLKEIIEQYGPNKPIILINTAVAYSNKKLNQNSYKFMANCSIEYQLKGIAILNKILTRLKSPTRVILDIDQEISGHSNYFWDAFHLSDEGAQYIAQKILKLIKIKKGKLKLIDKTKDGPLETKL